MWDGYGWVDWTELVLQTETQELLLNSDAHSLASPCSDEQSSIPSSSSSSHTSTAEQSLEEDTPSLIENLPAQPHFIDVGLHAAALAPPGYYRKEYYKPRSGPSLPPIKGVNAPLSIAQSSTPKANANQLPLTIPHAAGDLVSRPIKRRHVPADSAENVKRQKMNPDFIEQLLMPLEVEEGAVESCVSWDISGLAGVTCGGQEIEVRNDTDVVIKKNLKADVVSFSFKTEPGRNYSVKLIIYADKGNVVGKGEVECKAVFSLEEMDRLMSRALTCTGTWMQSFTHLYRCKPKIYFDDIHFRRNGVIEKYRKDNNGQAASPVNNEIYGLFFSARTLLDDTMAPSSCFGDMRMQLPAQKLLDPNRISLYFCDFYCNRLAHYVTVVICENGSESDEYCNERLIPLDWENNSFLRILPNDDPDNPFLYYINKCTWIEIYYTENVLMEWGTFHPVSSTGPGSAVGGLPHNKACTMCNLYPVNSKLNKRLEETLQKEHQSETLLTENK